MLLQVEDLLQRHRVGHLHRIVDVVAHHAPGWPVPRDWPMPSVIELPSVFSSLVLTQP